VLWVAFDTPVDDDDQADVVFVQNQIQAVMPHLAIGAVVLVSSQMPVGSIRKLEAFASQHLPAKRLNFACSPENLRLGKALDVFLKPDRIVVGSRTAESRAVLERLLLPVTDRIEWMSVESAEMTKHAINAFLATSVTFANEIASICEMVGADAKEVERGLKSEMRIGPKAYLSPGGPFAGGTFARDLDFRGAAGRSAMLVSPLLSSVRTSNDEHKNWTRRKLLEKFGDLRGVTVAVWGLTYKPGTDTLRRSLAVELCDWLFGQGALVHVHDPVVKDLPAEWAGSAQRFDQPLAAIEHAAALVLSTEWPLYKKISQHDISAVSPGILLLDANRFFGNPAATMSLEYRAVGTPLSSSESKASI
jgi:UDPglucose 6-dehydrogenase